MPKILRRIEQTDADLVAFQEYDPQLETACSGFAFAFRSIIGMRRFLFGSLPKDH